MSISRRQLYLLVTTGYAQSGQVHDPAGSAKHIAVARKR